MPITGPSSYIPGINGFLPHWAEANTVQAASGKPGELTVRVSPQLDAVKRADLLVWRNELEAFSNRIEEQILARDLARARNRELREDLHERFNQFNRTARATLIGTIYLKALPKVPPITVGESRICLAFQELNILWKSINSTAAAGEVSGQAGPLLLRGDYDQARFEAGIAKLRASYEIVMQHEQQLKITRMRRNSVQENVYATLRGYRATIQAQFPAEDPMVLSLPRLTPTPGSTPDPVAVEAVWDGTIQQAVITWEASDNPSIEHYEVRYSPGDSYDSDAETLQATVAPDAPREFLTSKGLTKPGDAALFKVFVVLETGNERGSEVITVKRPADALIPTTTLPDRLNGSVPSGPMLSA